MQHQKIGPENILHEDAVTNKCSSDIKQTAVITIAWITLTSLRNHCSVGIIAPSDVYVDLYSAFLRKAPQMCSDMDHTVLPANYTMPVTLPPVR